MRARCCCATAGISWAPLRVAPGPCSAPKASCFSQYDEDIYIYICVHPFLFDLESEETPVRSVSSLSLLSSLSRLYSGWGRGRGGHVRLVVGRLWMRDTAYRIWIFARMWARCLGNCSGKRHLLIGMYQVRAELIGCRSEIKIVVGNCAFFPW